MKSLHHIKIGHGSGGLMTRSLIHDLFQKHLTDPALCRECDAATLPFDSDEMVITTDAFVVDPLFFPGGDIGKLAVCGTLNDLAVSGSQPQFMAVSFILEEGFELSLLSQIVLSMAKEAELAGIRIVAGDTKVVPKGAADKIFISTTGIGRRHHGYGDVCTGDNIRSGDKIIVSGQIGKHGAAIFASRFPERIQSDLKSDCASLLSLTEWMLPMAEHVHFMRDATRGGLATVLNEICEKRDWGCEIYEAPSLISEKVKAICDLSGLDPWYLANEGTMVVVVDGFAVDMILNMLKQQPLGQKASMIGEISKAEPGKVIMHTETGGTRILQMLNADPLPRIC